MNVAAVAVHFCYSDGQQYMYSGQQQSIHYPISSPIAQYASQGLHFMTGPIVITTIESRYICGNN